MLRFLQTPTLTKKIVLGTMLLFVAVMMVVTLIPGISDSLLGNPTAASGVYAKVGDQEIKSVDVEEATRRIATERRFPEELIPMIRPQVANQMVQDAALVAEAHRLGIRVSDDELRGELQKNPQWGPILFPSGNFVGQDRYMDFVDRTFHLSTERFETLLRGELVKRKLYAVIEGPVSVADSEVESAFRKQNEKVKFDYAVLSAEDLMKQVKVTDSELQNYYNQHKADYTNSIPEKRKLRFIAIDSGKVNAQATPTELQDYYRQHQKEYQVPDRVKASHILIETKPGADGKVDAKVDAAARGKAEDLLKQLKAGANFEELAKKNSDDPGSGKQGGSLGWFQHGAMVAPFDAAAFALERKGQLSDVVKSQFGYHIIRLDDKEKAHTRTLDEVKAEITPVIEAQKKQTLLDNLGNKVADAAKKDGLEKAAAANGLQVVTTDFVGQTDSLPGIGNSMQFGQAAFAAKPKSAPALAKTDNGMAVFEVTDVRPPATPTFEEARPRVEQALRNEKASSMLNGKAEELAEKAKSYHDLKKAAKELGATVKDTKDFVNAGGQVPDLGSLGNGPAQVVFTLEPGQISNAIPAGRNGIVVQLTAKQAPSADELAKGKETTREAMLERKRNETLAIYTDTLVKRMKDEGKIKLNKDAQQPAEPGSPNGN